jgi:hypothetical protein
MNAEDAVPLSAEPGPDRLGDVDAAVPVDGDVGVEALDLERALRRQRRGGKEEERERPRDRFAVTLKPPPAGRQAWPHPPSEEFLGTESKRAGHQVRGELGDPVLRSRTTAL